MEVQVAVGLFNQSEDRLTQSFSISKYPSDGSARQLVAKSLKDGGNPMTLPPLVQTTYSSAQRFGDHTIEVDNRSPALT